MASETVSASSTPPSERRTSMVDKMPTPEIYDLMNELTKEAVEKYSKKMASFMDDSILPPSSLELRSIHAEAKQEAIDHFRKRFTGRPVGVWKLEREIDAIFQVMAIEAARVRKASFGSDNSDKSYTSPSTPGELDNDHNHHQVHGGGDDMYFINCV